MWFDSQNLRGAQKRERQRRENVSFHACACHSRKQPFGCIRTFTPARNTIIRFQTCYSFLTFSYRSHARQPLRNSHPFRTYPHCPSVSLIRTFLSLGKAILSAGYMQASLTRNCALASCHRRTAGHPVRSRLATAGPRFPHHQSVGPGSDRSYPCACTARIIALSKNQHPGHSTRTIAPWVIA